MAYTGRNQRYLALDSSVLIAYLDRQHPQHKRVTSLAKRRVALNPTVLHEAYHALVFKLKWLPREAAQVLREALNDKRNLFLNQTREITAIGLTLAETYRLGGRDASILANFLHPSISEMLTFDRVLFSLGTVTHGYRHLKIRQP